MNLNVFYLLNVNRSEERRVGKECILPPKCKRFLKRCIHAKLVIEIDTSGMEE